MAAQSRLRPYVAAIAGFRDLFSARHYHAHSGRSSGRLRCLRDGDSIKAFLSCRNNQVARIYALEPDRKNRVKLEQYKESLPRDLAARISIFPFAVGKQSGYVDFESGNQVRSRIRLAAKGEATECRTLDEICDGAGTTYIKMDIEG